MNLHFMEQGDGHAQLAHYLRSKAWWVITPLDDMGQKWLSALEHEFYDSKGFSGDFHMLLFPQTADCALLPVFFALKTRAPLTALERFTGQHIGGGQDILLLGRDLSTVKPVLAFFERAYGSTGQA